MCCVRLKDVRICVVDVRVFGKVEIWVVENCVIVWLWFSVCVISDFVDCCIGYVVYCVTFTDFGLIKNV